MTPPPLHQRLATRTRPFYLPLTFALSARLEQATWGELCGDAALVAFALRAGRSNFSADGLVNWFDPWFEAEALGVRLERDDCGRVTAVGGAIARVPAVEAFAAAPAVAVVVDVARRLCREIGERHAVLGYLTGGATLARNCLGGAAPAAGLDVAEALGRCSVHLARAYCEAGVAALLVVEEAAVTDPTIAAAGPLFNLADYYSTPVVVLHREPPAPGVEERLLAAGAYLVLYPERRRDDGNIVIPVAAFADGDDDAPALTAGDFAAAQLVTTAWDLPRESAPERVIELGQALARAGGQGGHVHH